MVCSHLGRPTGVPDPAYTLAPVAARLAQLLDRPVKLAADTVGRAARSAVSALAPGGVVMLENLRFNPGETSKDDVIRGAFADQLASLAELYVGDGFGAMHRKHANVYDVPARLPHAVGYLVQAETAALRRVTQDIQRPYTVVLGGAKVTDKLAVVSNLLGIADQILVGGAMAVTFLAAQGHPAGRSLLDGDLDDARRCLDQAAESGAEFVLPLDLAVAAERTAGARREVVASAAIPADRMALDIGPNSAVHTSLQRRAIHSADLALAACDRDWIGVRRSWRLNGRHYGALQGKDKARARARFGERQVELWRRSYDVPPPAAADAQSAGPRYAALPPEIRPRGESLRDVTARLLPYWYDSIVPGLRPGTTVLVVSHGNTLRALVKHLDAIGDDEIAALNIPNGIPLLYELGPGMRPLSSGRYL